MPSKHMTELGGGYFHQVSKHCCLSKADSEDAPDCSSNCLLSDLERFLKLQARNWSLTYARWWGLHQEMLMYSTASNWFLRLYTETPFRSHLFHNTFAHNTFYQMNFCLRHLSTTRTFNNTPLDYKITFASSYIPHYKSSQLVRTLIPSLIYYLISIITISPSKK